ncbi:MAG: hypothetical protein LAP13_22400 [Acidobacteriia bacterium]|nr:hypothetical protein [Terriglobia bacterium]
MGMDVQKIRAEVDKVIQAQWVEIAKAIPPVPGDPGSPGWISWEYRISPPFPETWPPKGTGRVFYYAYAAGRELSIVDGERLGPVWARVAVNAKTGSPPHVEILTREIKILGTVGVRPLTNDEVRIFQQGDAVEKQIHAVLSQTDLKGLDAKAVRGYYCAWCQNTGMDEQIRKLHPEFFKWLSCP